MKRKRLITVAALAVLALASCTKKAADENEPTPTATPEPTPEYAEPTEAEPEPEYAEPIEAPEPEPEVDWRSICADPIAAVRPAIKATGLRIAEKYSRSRGRIIDGVGPWGSYSAMCGELAWERPGLGEGLMVDVFLGPTDTETGAPIRCKRVPKARKVVEHTVAHLRDLGVPLDRMVTAYIMCTTRKGSGIPDIGLESQAVYNPKIQRVEKITVE